jgi:hypothetical protein
VARELQSHPDRFEIIKANPNITKRQASELARQYRSEQATVTINPDWRRQHMARWFKDLNNLATKVIQQAQITNAVVPQQLLREIVEPMAAWLPTIREAGEACITLVNDLENLLNQERFDGGDEAECIPAEAAE